MNSDKMTTIIAADYMYLVFLGDDKIINNMINKLNKNINDSIKPNDNENIYKAKKLGKFFKKKDYYVKCELNTPCVDLLDEKTIQDIIIADAHDILSKNNKEITNDNVEFVKKYVVLDEGVETAQCLTYADISSVDYKNKLDQKTMMLMALYSEDTHFKLSFPILQLDEEENPDKLIAGWLKDNKLDDIIKELTIRPVNIVGNEHEILVFTAFINQ